MQKSTVRCAVTEDVNLSLEGWQHYRKIERNARRVHEENGAGVLPTSGEPAGSDLRALYREQPSREKHRCRESSKGQGKGTRRVTA